MSTPELIATLGNLGEFLGSVAVLATLVYLSVQVSQAKRIARVNAAQARADSRIAQSIAQIDAGGLNAALANVELQLESNYDPGKSYVDNLRAAINTLDREARLMISNWTAMRVSDHRNVLFQIYEGHMPERFDLELEVSTTAAYAQAMWGDPPRSNDPFYLLAEEHLRSEERRVAEMVADLGGYMTRQTMILNSPAYADESAWRDL